MMVCNYGSIDIARLKEYAAELARLGTMRAVWGTGKFNGWHRVRHLHAAAVEAGLVKRTRRGAKNMGELEEQVKPVEPEGQIRPDKGTVAAPPQPGEVRRFIFTCAQNDTKLHEGLWQNIIALSKYYDAEIHVSRFIYMKRGLGAGSDKALILKRANAGDGNSLKWDARLLPYLSDGRVQVAKGLTWCGEMNTMPTAVRPLSGLEVYTGRNSMIAPHPKIAMESIASTRHEPTKFNYTTGTVTLQNYIQRKAGLKAAFHHCYGALLVEVSEDGWFCRQLHADSEGTIHDLDVAVHEGRVTVNNPVEAITWGDIHVAEREDWVFNLAFGAGGMLDQLQPRFQFLHDVLHFRGRSHHEVKNPHTMFKRHVQGEEDVRAELIRTGNFLWGEAWRFWCTNVVVGSNHHRHIGRWLQEQDGRYDPVNAEFWIDLQRRVYETIRKGERVDHFLLALNAAGFGGRDITFLGEDDSFTICEDVECGQHGDLGPNGSRGNIKTFAKLGRRTNIGHSHSAGICDGAYQAGTCGTLNPDWTTGPSSWSHSHIVTYPNGKRAIVTMWNGKWRA